MKYPFSTHMNTAVACFIHTLFDHCNIEVSQLHSGLMIIFGRLLNELSVPLIAHNMHNMFVSTNCRVVQNCSFIEYIQYNI